MKKDNQQYGVAVKILIYTGCIPEDVVYYQYNIPVQFVERWKWYFEYLAARIKVAHPKRKVELCISAQENCLCGSDYVSEKTKSLLRSKAIKLKKLRTGRYEDDLFGLAKADKEAKVQSVQAEIEALERGEFNYYIPPTYINKIKKYLYGDKN